MQSARHLESAASTPTDSTLQSLLAPGENLLARLVVDLDERLHFARTVLGLTERRLLVLSPAGDKAAWPLSDATTLDDIIAEMQVSRTSERQGRLIDRDEAGSMEKKKREGYF